MALSYTEFRELIKEFERDTCFESSLKRMREHRCYQEIVSHGRVAISYIIGEFDKATGSPVLFVMLSDITGVDPAKGERTVAGAKDKWEQWAEKEGYI